jgi:peptide/nickel transport system permease protein
MLGRDIAFGILAGAKGSLITGGAATVMALVIGVSIGATSGFFGGVVGSALMAFTELFQTVPAFLLAIVIVAILGPSLFTIAGAIGAVSWPAVARLTRAEVSRIRAQTFTRAAMTLGETPLAILFGHVLPNAMGPVVVMTSFIAADAILIEGGLSFLGLGDTNYVSWGAMIASGRTVLRQAWWVSTMPGLALLGTVLIISLLGESLARRLTGNSMAGVR